MNAHELLTTLTHMFVFKMYYPKYILASPRIFNQTQLAKCVHPLVRFLSTEAIASSSSSPVNKYTERTHNCGQLSKDDIGKSVVLSGWVQHTRFNNKIIALRDSYGTVQCIVGQDTLTKEFRRQNINNESVITVSGVVRARPEGKTNDNTDSGGIEVLADQVNIVSKAKGDLPILIRETDNATLVNNLKNRYLYLRKPEMQHALRFRSKVNRVLRNKLYQLGFVECETPTLFNRTPGGANEFIVPTQDPGKFYSLVQSPQQLKQLLMVGGIDRYFQICRCYRDEAGRSDRQPEFSQLDIELSFTNQSLVISLIDDLVHDLMTGIADDQDTIKMLTSSFNEDGRLPKMSYKDAMEKYGTDKPDLRFQWIIHDAPNRRLQFVAPHVVSDLIVHRVTESVQHLLQRDLGIETVKSEGEVKFVAPDQSDGSREALGILRTRLAQILEQSGTRVYEEHFKFTWVTDFPLFTVGNDGKLKPNHHPFTAPTEKSIHLLDTEPLSVRGQHYDLVLNGQEVAGGSIRIHQAELQRRIFSSILKVEDNTFEYFLEALSSGCPPHGGIAFGLDRLVAILMSRESIRDVMAFPKSQNGRDLMTDCPQEISNQVKRLYHIK